MGAKYTPEQVVGHEPWYLCSVHCTAEQRVQQLKTREVKAEAPKGKNRDEEVMPPPVKKRKTIRNLHALNSIDIEASKTTGQLMCKLPDEELRQKGTKRKRDLDNVISRSESMRP